MEIYEAAEAFASLSQETRLKILKLLIQFGRDGLPPGKIAKKLKIPNNTLSFHLAHMNKVGLTTSLKKGRSLTYFFNQKLIQSLIGFLKENCCEQEKKSKPCKTRKC